MPGLQRPEELTRLGLELMAIEAGASPGDVPTVGSGGSVTYQPAGGASFPPEWTVGGNGSLIIDGATPDQDFSTVIGVLNSPSTDVAFQITNDWDNFGGFNVDGMGRVSIDIPSSVGGALVISIAGDNCLVVRDDNGSPALGFFGHAAINQPTGVAVNAAGIHAALVSLGLITA